MGISTGVRHRWVTEHTRVSPGYMQHRLTVIPTRAAYERSERRILIRSADWGKYLNWFSRLFNHRTSWQISSREVHSSSYWSSSVSLLTPSSRGGRSWCTTVS